jgi:predicted transcriptional regulator YheO
MMNHSETFQLLRQVAVGIQKLLHPFCEIVIHDFTDLERSIIYIEGNISGRSIGGAATDLLLSQARSGNTTQDFYNYETQLPNGRTMKSCTLFMRDENGDAYGAFCINMDIGAFRDFQNLLSEFTAVRQDGEVQEILSDDIHKTIHTILMDSIKAVGVGKDLPILNREEKVELIAKLDERGVFQVKKAVNVVADELGLSRSTVYNYLSEARGGGIDSAEEDSNGSV